MTKLTQEQLKELLYYAAITGIFTWIKRTGDKVKVGAVAGCFSRGYTQIRINNKTYLAHRLAWFYHYGEWPKGQIDHINGIKNDNRIENLRDVSKRNNQSNLKCHREGHLLGSNLHKPGGKWRSSIYVEGKAKRLGCFDTQQEAHEAYLRALSELSR